MNAEQAVGIVESRRAELDLPDDMQVSEVERAIVAVRRVTGALEDRIAWLVTLSNRCGVARVDLDEQTSEVLNLRSSA